MLSAVLVVLGTAMAVSAWSIASQRGSEVTSAAVDAPADEARMPPQAEATDEPPTRTESEGSPTEALADVVVREDWGQAFRVPPAASFAREEWAPIQPVPDSQDESATLVATNNLTLRSEPGAFEVRGVARAGSPVTPVGEQSRSGGIEWVKIRDTHGVEGWAVSDFLADPESARAMGISAGSATMAGVNDSASLSPGIASATVGDGPSSPGTLKSSVPQPIYLLLPPAPTSGGPAPSTPGGLTRGEPPSGAIGPSVSRPADGATPPPSVPGDGPANPSSGPVTPTNGSTGTAQPGPSSGTPGGPPATTYDPNVASPGAIPPGFSNSPADGDFVPAPPGSGTIDLSKGIVVQPAPVDGSGTDMDRVAPER